MKESNSLFSKALAKLTRNPWRTFAVEVRGKQDTLLKNLDMFPDSVLVCGCQRSGTTAVSRLIRQGANMVDFQTSSDDELDGALILAGAVQHESKGRYCFQTTYLNERYREYSEHTSHRIVWVLRNPFSVVYSMLNNWGRFALNELFLNCGIACMDHVDRVKFQRFGIDGVPLLHRAAYAYAGKVAQIDLIMKNYPLSRIAVIEYDQIIAEKEAVLPVLFDFVGVPYDSKFGKMLHRKSLDNKNNLASHEIEFIEGVCMSAYEQAKLKISIC